MQHSPAIHHTIVVVDIEDFTNPVRTELHHTAMHNGLYDVLGTAFDNAGVRWSACAWEDRGDGVLILVPPQFAKSLIVARLPDLLVAGLTRYNAVHVAEAGIHLRMAVHCGEVAVEAEGKSGIAVNETFRMLESEMVKAELHDSRGTLAVIASETIYRDVIHADPAAQPAKFHPVEVRVKHTQTTAWLRILGDDSRVLPTFSPNELGQLRELLTGVTVFQLPTMLARAAGAGVPPMRREADAWQAVEYLLDFNAGRGGLPPAMIFVDLLAGQVGQTLGDRLRAWNDLRAQRLRLADALAQARLPQAATGHGGLRLHLVILIEHDGLDPDRYLVSHWRQADPLKWPPARGATRTAAFHELEWVVDDLVMDAEAAWSGHDGDAALEFVLPRALLGLPVDRWCRERHSGDPRPLALDYLIVIRSLERMLSRHWHRVWRAKWRTLVDAPQGASAYFADSGDAGRRYHIDVALKDARVVSMALSGPPEPAAGVPDELSAALRAGLPAVLWSRAEESAAGLRDLIGGYAESGRLGDLPQHVFVARQEALGRAVNLRAVQDWVILWDNPGRLLYLDQPPPPVRTERNTADERERAS